MMQVEGWLSVRDTIEVLYGNSNRFTDKELEPFTKSLVIVDEKGVDCYVDIKESGVGPENIRRAARIN